MANAGRAHHDVHAVPSSLLQICCAQAYTANLLQRSISHVGVTMVLQDIAGKCGCLCTIGLTLHADLQACLAREKKTSGCHACALA